MIKQNSISWSKYLSGGLRRRFGEVADTAKLCRGVLRRQRIYAQFKSYTMISPQLYRANLAIAEQYAGVPGCVVECGVWRGGMIGGLAKVFGANRQYFLFDSFEGLPPAKQIDGAKALAWQSQKDLPTYYDNCAAPEVFADRAMKLSGAKSYTLVKGWFDKTVPNFNPPVPIALLRLDGDWYESTMVCLEHLFDRVAQGGVVLLDDYYTWDGCSRALHDFLSCRSATERVHSLGGVCYLQKH